MTTLASIRSFLRAWLLRRQTEHEMDEEMHFHLEARAADLMARGMSREEADKLR